VSAATQSEFIERAVHLARQNVSLGRGGPFGAVIVKNGLIIAEASNQVTVINDPTAHAEILAIREACKKLNNFSLEGCDLYASCEPCPMCLGAIYWAKINRVYYAVTRTDAENAGFKDSLIYREMCKPSADQMVPMVKIENNDALDVLIAWKKAEQKILY
jgi:guanine deaminase